jgi:hypothetical protein
MPESLAVILVVGILGGVVLSIVYYTLRNGISPMPSSRKAVRAMIPLVEKGRERRLILELGSGWGRLAAVLAASFPDSRVIGIENSMVPLWISRVLYWRRISKNLSVRRADFFRCSFAGADVLVCYLYPGAMARLTDKILAECADHCLVISNTFALPGWMPIHRSHLGGWWDTSIYVYRVGENRYDRDPRDAMTAEVGIDGIMDDI